MDHTVDLRYSPTAIFIRWHGAPGNDQRLVEPAVQFQIDRERVALEEAERRGTPTELANAQRQLGQRLFTVLDGPEHALQHRLNAARSSGWPLHLVLRLLAAEPKALSHHPALGWHLQLLTPPSSPTEEPLALQRDITLTVQLGDSNTASPELLTAGRFQFLFMASSPSDVVPVLDYEAEEERILDELAPFVEQRRMAVHVAEEGSLAELKRRLMRSAYDIVHLSGHGTVTEKGPRLLMEDELGAHEQISPEQLLTVLRAGRVMPRLVVLASCQTAEQRSDLPSLAAELLQGGVPCVVGWTRPVGDGDAIRAAAEMYQCLCKGEVPTQALARARQRLHEEDLKRPRPQHAWATLQLLTTHPMGFSLTHEDKPLQGEPPASESIYRLLGRRMRVLERGFVGRRRELQALERVLRRGTWAARGKAERPVAGVAVIGMKGQGKSCLVGRTVDRHLQDTGELSLVVLHGALNELSVAEAFWEEAVRFNDSAIQALLRNGSLPLMRRLEPILRGHWRERRLVIILDDFEQNLDIPSEGEAHLRLLAASLLEVLVPSCLDGKPKLLFTSTARFSLPAHLQGALAELELGALDGASVSKLWMRGQNGKELAYVRPSEWTSLSQRLGRNARILDWARQLLGGKTPEEVREIATRAGQQLPVWTDSAPDKARQDELVALFLKHMAFEEAQAKIGPDALTFIERARVYEDPVPEEALAGLTEGLSVSLDRHLVALANLGLVELGREEDTRVYRVSPLIKEVFDAPDGERWHAVAAAYWWQVAKRTDGWHAPSVLQAWRHALKARQQASADESANIISPWLEGLGHFAESTGMSQQHVTAFPKSIVGLLWAGYARYQAGHPREGLPLLQRGVELARSLSVDHPRLLQARELLARVLAALGEHSEARQQLEEILAAEESAHPAGSHRLASALHVLAGVLEEEGDLPQARALLERSLVMTKKAVGTAEHPNVAASLHALARVLHALGDLPRARFLLERSLEIEKKIFGTDEHPNVAASLHVLATVVQDQGDLPQARSLLERSIDIEMKLHGTAEHPNVAASLHALAGVLQAEGDLPQARSLLERALFIYERVFGTEEHPDVSASLHALAGVLNAQGDLPTARSLLERSIDIETKLQGTEEHPDVAASLHVLASVLGAQGDLAQARSLLERALLVYEKVFATEEHPSVSASLHTLALVLQAQGDLPTARSLLERSIDIDKMIFGTEDHYDAAVSYVSLARCLQALDLRDESEAAFSKALSIFKRHHRAHDHYMIAEAEIEFALLLISRGRQGKALSLLLHAFPVLKAQVANHPLLHQFQLLAPRPVIDLIQLAYSALNIRSTGGALPEELIVGIRSLRSAGGYHHQVVDFLEQLARGGPLPSVPPDLPEDAANFVAAVRQAAEETSARR